MKNEYLTKKVDEWIQEQKYQEYSANTLNQYKTNVMKFVNWIPDNTEITKDLTIEYKKYLYELNPKPSTRSINVWIIELNKFLKWLGYSNATLEKFKIQQKNSNEEIITIADYKRLLRFAKRQNKMDLYFIMKILIMTGIRISELKYFTFESLNSNKKLKELCDRYEEEHSTTFEIWQHKIKMWNQLKEYITQYEKETEIAYVMQQIENGEYENNNLVGD